MSKLSWLCILSLLCMQTLVLGAFWGLSAVSYAKVYNEVPLQEVYLTPFEQIVKIAKERGLSDQETVKLLKLIDCESKFDQWALHSNRDGSIDRGLYQISNKWHKEIDTQCTFDLVCSTNKVIDIYKKDKSLRQWACNKKI